MTGTPRWVGARRRQPRHRACAHAMAHILLCSAFMVHTHTHIHTHTHTHTRPCQALLKFWPVTNSQKEVLFLGELEEILELTQVGFCRLLSVFSYFRLLLGFERV
jgi:hypothetical protein